MINGKPFKQFTPPMIFSDETTLMGVPVKELEQIMMGNFEKNLKRGNKIVLKLKNIAVSENSTATSQKK